MQCVYDGIVPIFYADGKNLLMGDDEYIENYFQRDNEQQLKLRVEKLSDWDKDFQTKVIQSALLMYDKKKENWNGQLGQPQSKIGELTAERIAKWVFNAAVLTGDKMDGPVSIMVKMAGQSRQSRYLFIQWFKWHIAFL